MILLFILFIVIISILLTTQCVQKFTNLNNYEIYVINLDRRNDRLDNIDNVLTDAELDYTRISAVDGSVFDTVYALTYSEGYDDLKCLGGDDRKGHLPHTGCYLSHIKCLKKARNSKYDKVLILEDDAEFIIKDFSKTLNKIVNENSDIDFIWLNSDQTNTVYDKHDIPRWGLHGYIVSKKAAIMLYDTLNPDSKWIKDRDDCLIDLVIQDALKYSKLTWKHYTLIRQQDNVKSDITGEIKRKNANLLKI